MRATMTSQRQLGVFSVRLRYSVSPCLPVPSVSSVPSDLTSHPLTRTLARPYNVRRAQTYREDVVRILIGAALLVVTLGADAFAQRAIVLVRHAEKLDHSDDPPLSAAGLTRSRALDDLLRGAGVSVIIASEFRRTQSTATPLAKRLQITPEIMKALEVDALIARLRRAPADAVVLVIGHSNTLPIILTKLGWTGTVDLQDRDYDDVFVVTPRGDREPSVLRLKYGKKTS
jgi:broad specificity phosphatase PhoE